MCAGVCLMDRCVCHWSACRSAHLTCLGGYFLYVLSCTGSYGYSSVLGFGQVVSSYPGSCFLYFIKVMALFSNSPSNDNSVQNCKTVLHIFTSLSKSIASYIRFLKC